MLRAEELAKVATELKKLESALNTCTDGRIREVIEIRIEERTLWQRQLLAFQPERLSPGQPQRRQQHHPLMFGRRSVRSVSKGF
jgi:hypothetical protein